MDDTHDVDWSSVTFEGSRRRQHEAFRSLTFPEKILRLEQMAEVSRFFAEGHAQRALGKARRSGLADVGDRLPGS